MAKEEQIKELHKVEAKAGELTIVLGQHAAITLLNADGTELGGGFSIEVRTTEEGSVQVFCHTKDLCNRPGGCQPFISADIGEAKRKRVEAEMARAREEFGDLLDGLKAIFGGANIYTVDENGVRPLDPKKQN